MGDSKVTKSDLIDGIADDLDMPAASVKKVVDALFESVLTALKDDNSVQIHGFGTFEIRARKGGTRKSFGKVVEVPDRKVPAFSFSLSTKNSVTEALAPKPKKKTSPPAAPKRK